MYRKGVEHMSNIVCLCKGVSEETIVEAIKNGAKTFDEVSEKRGGRYWILSCIKM